MKYSITYFCLVILLFSCGQSTQEKVKMDKMNKSFKLYIKDNDVKKDFITKLKKVEVLSFKEILTENKEDANERYEARVYMYGTTSYINSSKIYNLSDTVIGYFDESFKMLRLVNPNQGIN